MHASDQIMARVLTRCGGDPGCLSGAADAYAGDAERLRRMGDLSAAMCLSGVADRLRAAARAAEKGCADDKRVSLSEKAALLGLPPGERVVMRRRADGVVVVAGDEGNGEP